MFAGTPDIWRPADFVLVSFAFFVCDIASAHGTALIDRRLIQPEMRFKLYISPNLSDIIRPAIKKRRRENAVVYGFKCIFLKKYG
jgi:hypothetical protein